MDHDVNLGLSAGEASWEHQHTSNQTSICSSYRVKTRLVRGIGIAAGCMFTLSHRSPAAPRVDPGGVIVSDAPHHSQTVRLHTQQMSRNLTPEPEPTAGTVCAQTCDASPAQSHTRSRGNQIKHIRQFCSMHA